MWCDCAIEIKRPRDLWCKNAESECLAFQVKEIAFWRLIDSWLLETRESTTTTTTAISCFCLKEYTWCVIHIPYIYERKESVTRGWPTYLPKGSVNQKIFFSFCDDYTCFLLYVSMNVSFFVIPWTLLRLSVDFCTIGAKAKLFFFFFSKRKKNSCTFEN